MPYEWLADDARSHRLQLWPHRSLTQRGFVWFIGLTAALVALPLLAILGSPALWAMLPFILAAFWAIWFALRKNGRDRDVLEELRLSPDLVTLVRYGSKGDRQEWQTNPYWVRVTLYAEGGPVPNYLTLRGGGREVEIGAFLSEDERPPLAQDLRARLADLRGAR